MPYYVRRMCAEDIAQVDEIDREAFPTLWPPANYKHELQNRLAHYIVAYDEGKTVEGPEVKPTPERGLSRLVYMVGQLFARRSSGKELPPSDKKCIVGFCGFWIMADEAHITNIAVRERYQRQGIGELLLLATIDLAVKLSTRLLTLEVRVSNTTAQNLYYKCGFTKTGLRQGYYTDNKEDALLMSVENINSAPFQAHLQQLKQAHSRKWGVARYELLSYT